jgi:hypothetical protein
LRVDSKKKVEFSIYTSFKELMPCKKAYTYKYENVGRIMYKEPGGFTHKKLYVGIHSTVAHSFKVVFKFEGEIHKPTVTNRVEERKTKQMESFEIAMRDRLFRDKSDK